MDFSDHDHTIPGFDLPVDFLITDHSSKGLEYDCVQSAWFYSFNVTTSAFAPMTAGTPVNWLNFDGQWGDAQLPNDAKGQHILAGQAKYSGGPNGPKFKGLSRTNIWPDGKPTILQTKLNA